MIFISILISILILIFIDILIHIAILITMKILIACDSFKDSLDALEVCRAIGDGIQQARPQFAVQLFPLADGGEGTADILTYHAQGRWIEKKVYDPLFRNIKAGYGLSADGKTAFVDMAQASGLQLLKPEERNPLETSTFGTGQLLLDAIQGGAQKIVLGIGGSATNDGGIGMAIALGYTFKDKHGQPLKGLGKDLQQIAAITSPAIHLPDIEVLCDVTNLLYGPQGAAMVYGRQKGADEMMQQVLDRGLQHLSAQVVQTLGVDKAHEPGAGAAGGMGYGALVFLNGQLRSGIHAVMQEAQFDEQLTEVDLIITGEGKIDDQTLQGKLISGICARATSYDIPVIAICGALLADPKLIRQMGLKAAFSIQTRPRSLSEALASTKEELTQLSFHLAHLL